MEVFPGCEEQLQHHCWVKWCYIIQAVKAQEHKGNQLCLWTPGGNFLFSNQLHQDSLEIWFHI